MENEQMMTLRQSQLGDLTALLAKWTKGDQKAFDEVVLRVYDDIKRVAGFYISQESSRHGLQTTELVHEVYLQLSQESELYFENRSCFFAFAGHLVRRLLTAKGRERGRIKRGGDAIQLNIDSLSASSEALRHGVDMETAMTVSELVEKLLSFDARKGRIVEMRFFGGLTMDEVAAVLDVSLPTVKRDWSVAKRWLLKELKQQEHKETRAPRRSAG